MLNEVALRRRNREGLRGYPLNFGVTGTPSISTFHYALFCRSYPITYPQAFPISIPLPGRLFFLFSYFSGSFALVLSRTGE